MFKLAVSAFLTMFLFTGNVLAVETSAKKTEEPVAKDEIVVTEDVSGIEEKANAVFIYTKDKLETFRKKQAVYFATLRDETKVKIGIGVTNNILEKIAPDFAAPAAPSTNSDPQKLGDLSIKKVDNPVDYGKLIFATAMASLFASVLMFYTVLIFLTFFLIRFIFRAFI